MMLLPWLPGCIAIATWFIYSTSVIPADAPRCVCEERGEKERGEKERRREERRREGERREVAGIKTKRTN